MKLNAKLFRCATVPSDYFASVVGLPETAEPLKVEAALREEFGPFADGFQIFWANKRAIAGIEAIAFTDSEANVPKAGVVHIEPGNSRDVARLEGALVSELARMGLTVEYKELDWKIHYELKGN